jgi:peptidoglycan/LPS O-acetylase OafA/YrhL
MVTMAAQTFFAVYTFFWIGGFLITLGMLEQLKKSKNLLKFYIGSIIHRFIRIWPTYVIAILMFWKVATYSGDGPIWKVLYDMSCSCNNGGVLWNMLFIDNFGNHGPVGRDYCFGWGWYLAVDFQLFLITPFILYAYHKNKKLGWIVTFMLFMASIITAFTQILVNDWHYPIPNPKLPAQPNFMDKFYYKPWTHASSYCMGIFSGFIYV